MSTVSTALRFVVVTLLIGSLLVGFALLTMLESALTVVRGLLPNKEYEE